MTGMPKSTIGIKHSTGVEWDEEEAIGQILTLDKYTVMSAKECVNAEFDFVDGYGWKNGFNSVICREMQAFFELRNKFKAQKNPHQTAA